MHIELRHIHKRFGPVHANNDINLTFGSGRIIGILGENGAGKSTLMKTLSGFQSADSGEIWLDGKHVDYTGPEAAIQNGVGMLQQDPLDVAAFTVLENFTYGQPGSFLPNRKAARHQLAELSRRFGFELDPETPIAQISIGQRQQLEIVRLLALGVRTLILDEPTTGISAEQKTILFDALRTLATRDSMTVLLVSHKLEDVIALCHEVAVLRAGQVVGTRDMPATTGQLVTMMFGQELKPHTREREDLSTAPVALELAGVTLRGKRVTVENFSLKIRAGEIVGLAGLDGSGQEMALRAAVGLEKPQDGRVLIQGSPIFASRLEQWLAHLEDVLRSSERLFIPRFLVSLLLTVVSDQPYRRFLERGVAFGAAGRLEEGLVAGLTLTEHIAIVTERQTLVDWGRAAQHTAAQMKTYDVRGRPESQIETLSGGNQQRMLMALMPEKPVLMVLEQPTRGLDVDSARWIWQQLLSRQAKGTAILFSSPELDELVAYSDRILVFYAGQVFEVPDASRTSADEIGHLIGGHFEEQTT
ncbi:MAG: ATP-binding cassette domain-containing protein [Anaerolineaceae bacterium]|nr:ATP-binding cassette domain-containing protein [Anaerolineaceae bacterium]